MIPEEKIRERCCTSMENLLLLLSNVAEIRAYDNRAEAAPGESVAEPRLVLHFDGARCLFPTSDNDLRANPDWAKPLVEVALSRT